MSSSRNEASESATRLIMTNSLTTYKNQTLRFAEFSIKKTKNRSNEIQKIDSAYKTFMTKIVVKDANQYPSIAFPPFITIEDKGKKYAVKIIDFDKSVFAETNSTRTTYDTHLEHYRDAISKLIKLIYNFYISRSSKKDKNSDFTISSNVLCYIGFLLNQYFLEFQGYLVDITYLDAISQFVANFIKQTTHPLTSPGMMHSNDITKQFTRAKQALIQHQNSIQQQVISIAKKNFLSSTEQTLASNLLKIKPFIENFIILLAKSLRPQQDWETIDSTIIENFKNIATIDPPFHQWIKLCGMEFTDEFENNTFQIEKDKFQKPQFVIDNNAIKSLKKCTSIFISSAYHKDKFTLFSTANEFSNTVETLRKICIFIDRLIAMRHFYRNLWSFISSKLTSIESDHFDFLLMVLGNFNHYLKLVYDQLEIAISLITKKFNGVVLPTDQQALLAAYKEQLNMFTKELFNPIQELISSHQKSSLQQAVQFELPADNIFNIASQLIKNYELNIEFKEAQNSRKKTQTNTPRHLKIQTLATPSSGPQEPFESPLSSSRPITKKKPTKTSGNKTPSHSNTPDSKHKILQPDAQNHPQKTDTDSITPESNSDSENGEDSPPKEAPDFHRPGQIVQHHLPFDRESRKLESNLRKIRRQIKAIVEDEKPSVKMNNAYASFLRALNDLKVKADQLQNETEYNRKEKGYTVQQLTIDLCGKTREHLKLDKNSRINNSRTFTASIQTIIELPKYQSINDHTNWFGYTCKFIKDILLCISVIGIYHLYKRGGLFTTATREQAYQTEIAARELENALKP